MCLHGDKCSMEVPQPMPKYVLKGRLKSPYLHDQSGTPASVQSPLCAYAQVSADLAPAYHSNDTPLSRKGTHKNAKRKIAYALSLPRAKGSITHNGQIVVQKSRPCCRRKAHVNCVLFVCK